MVTFVLLVVVLGGMIIVHEFGHFIVARFFKIEVEEFGLGFPPRVLRLWRGGGHLVIGGQTVMIPANVDLPFETQNGLQEEANATVDKVNDRLVLRSIELVRADRMFRTAGPAQERDVSPRLKDEYLPAEQRGVEKVAAPVPVKASGLITRGSMELHGVLTEISPGTELTLNAIPLGGFVRPKGENNPDIADGLAGANPWKRLAVLVAGPMMNLLTAVVVASIMIAQMGIAVPGTLLIRDVTAGSPAALAGMKPNDVILSINGKPATDVAEAITVIRANLDKPVEMIIQRGSQQLTITATPLSSRPVEQGALGVALGYPTRPAGLGEAVTGGVALTGVEAATLVYLPIGLMQGAITPDQARISGIKGIYDALNSALQRDTQTRQQPVPTPGGNTTPPAPPSDDVLSLIVLMSVTLGIFNLFPIPALDGGRILFTMPEILFRKRIPPRFENAVNAIAFFVLIGLMVYINLMDFINPLKIP